MPELTMADILAASGGGYDPYADPSGGTVTPASVLQAFGHVLAPGLVGSPYGEQPQPSAREAAAKLSAGKTNIDPLEAIAGIGGAAGGMPAMFIGPSARTWSPKAMAQFERLIGQGKTVEEARQATGIDLTAGQQPRAEISDVGATINPKADIGTFSPMTLDRLLMHPDLYKAYPEMGKIPVSFHDPIFDIPGQKVSGGMDLGQNPPKLLLNPNLTPEEMRSTILHETQHAVQRTEGFPSGGGMETPEVVAATAKSLPERKAAYEQTIADISNRAGNWSMQQAEGDPSKAAGFINAYFEANPAETALMKTALEEKAKYNRGRMLLEEKFKHYRSLAGETEARNVQTRSLYTPEDIRNISPESTQDVPFAEQLIRYAYPKAAAAPPLQRPVQPVLPPTSTTPQGRFNFQQEPLSFTERMAQGQDIAQELRNRGRSMGNYGLPLGGNPQAPLTSAQRFGAEQQAGYRADMGRILDAYREATGLPRAGTERPLLAPGERPEDLQFSTAPLFDYSRLGEVPNVPQTNLPRVVPPEGVPAATEKLASPANVARINEAVQRGEAMGGREWYNAEPLREQFVSELGEAEGNRRFRMYMDMVAANSPRTRVPENIRNASYYYGLLNRGDPIPEQYLSKGYWRITPGTQAPSPYGIMPIHVQNMENVVREGIPPLQNPKPASFVENLVGNQQPVTIDTHNMRLITSGARDQPNPNEYGFLERMQQAEAAKMGMSPAQYQASAWLGAGKQTGLASPTEPFLRTLENRIAITAEKTGRSKAEVLRDFIRGQAPLLSLGAVLAGAAGQPSPAPAQ